MGEKSVQGVQYYTAGMANIRTVCIIGGVCSSVGRALMPRKQRVVCSNPTEGSSFFCILDVELFAFACL